MKKKLKKKLTSNLIAVYWRALRGDEDEASSDPHTTAPAHIRATTLKKIKKKLTCYLIVIK